MAEHTGRGRTAIVIGGGLAGMLAVTALRGHVETITVVERDRYPADRTFRKGVPQARHLHLLLSGGQRALDRLLPGTVAALTAAGALQTVSAARSAHPYAHRVAAPLRRAPASHAERHPTGPGRRGPRAGAARRRRPGDPRRGPGGDRGRRPRRRRPAGHRRQGPHPRRRPLRRDGPGAPADLVVDASGRGSRTPRWCAELGGQAPQEETVDSGLAYATRMYRPLDQDGAPEVGVNVPGWPECPRAPPTSPWRAATGC
ncbi:hypothetical protein O1L44_03750 [Streptomyces noursei]|nr:hypothetical protein [Streptomyces noursei]